MKKQSNKNRKFLNFIYVLFILLLLSWIFFWGNNSFYKKWKLKRKIDRMEQQYNTLKAQNDSLADYNYRLKTDPETAEEVAREEHGLIKSDETVFISKKPVMTVSSRSKNLVKNHLNYQLLNLL